VSLAIPTRFVTAVLLADGWHEIKPGGFMCDAYEFMYGGCNSHGPGGLGFVFEGEDGRFIQGPISSILAVKEGEGNSD
jgi:hypothetical protein